MQNQQIPLYSTYQPSLSYRLRHSKALIAIVAVLGVTVMALAAALVVNRSGGRRLQICINQHCQANACTSSCP
jgi:capsular polysaccharide biosynthesis protein